jgi:hypothetical protein
MIVLDSDHLRELQTPGRKSDALYDRLHASGDPEVTTTIVSVAEAMRGWLALTNTADAERLIRGYAELGDLIDYFSEWDVLPYDLEAHREFARLKANRAVSRIKTLDLRIAAIVLSRAGSILLLSADAHFGTIAAHTALRVEDWRSYP